MKKNLLILFIVVGLGLVGGSEAICAPPELESRKPAVILQTPQQVEQYMRLDDIEAFSHDQLFMQDVQVSENMTRLKLDDAIDLGIKNNLITKISVQKVDEALGRKMQAMAALLPNINAGVAQQRTFRENFESQGLKFPGLNTSNVGPFNTFDARLQLTQQVINFSAVSNFKAGVKDVNAARYDKEFNRQKVVLLVALDYLDALRAQGDYKAAEANLKLSRKLLDQAQDQFQSGLANSVDVARAQTRVAQDEFKMANSRTGVHDAFLELQRSTGLPYDGVLKMMNTLGFIREAVPARSDAMAQADEKRLDLQVAKEHISASQYRLLGAKEERLPQIDFVSDLGPSGIEPNKTDRMASSFTVRLTMPIWDSGRISGEVKESNAQEKQAEIFYDDLKRQVEEDIQKALWLIDTDTDQVIAAGHVVGLSKHELDLASDRFMQGVGDNIEVLNAQTALEEARSQYVSALTLYHAARVNLYFALGESNSFYLQDVVQK